MPSTLRTEFVYTVTAPMGVSGDLIPVAGIATTIYNVNPDGTEGSQATAYAGRTGATLAPSLNTDSSGKVAYYLDPGDYNVHFSDPQSPPRIASFIVAFSSVPAFQASAFDALQATVNNQQNSITTLTNQIREQYVSYFSEYSVNVTANFGDFIHMISDGLRAYTVTLPAPTVAAIGQRIGVFVDGSVSGTNPVNVRAADGSNMFGKGWWGVTSIPLGTAGGILEMLCAQYNGTPYWVVANGQGDTGWLNCTYTTGFAPQTGGQQFQAKQVADRVYMRGGILNSSAGTVATSVVATLPAAVDKPIFAYAVSGYHSGGDGFLALNLSATGTFNAFTSFGANGSYFIIGEQSFSAI